jgi:hypothetical protein
MCHTHLELDPVRHRQLWTAIETARAKLKQHDGNRHTPWTQLTIDAIINTVTTGAGNSAVPEISVLIDLDTLIDGVHATTTCETDTGIPLPVSTIRRMACDADIVPIVLNGAGRVLDVGRSQRTATADQRRAIRTRVRTPPPPHPRRRLDPHHHPQPHRHLDTTRPHHLLDRPHHQPHPTSRLTLDVERDQFDGDHAPIVVRWSRRSWPS